MTILHTQRHDALPLRDALAAFPGRTLAGFFMTPARFLFTRWDGKVLENTEKTELDQAYEARFFDGDGELRWMRDPAAGDAGSAVWISETDTTLEGWVELDVLTVKPMDNSRRLLTGTLAGPHEELAAWHWMHAPRHGKVAIPITAGEEGQRLAYMVREYIGPAPGSAGDDGNRMVVEERIIGIESVEGAK